MPFGSCRGALRCGRDRSVTRGDRGGSTLSADTEIRPCTVADTLFCGDARDMSAVPSKSCALVVTSPPYFAAKDYEVAVGTGGVPATYVEYLAMLRDVFDEC